ncbi:glycerophosphodiester phosphodiesterase [Rhizosaccharibacter radicis]|uniref:glycerophosphodiester phosphodiesterase n=1 Tax=Rhizosaccharibacter radicis TaxID=2782605 RepID=A0ABT1VYD7_9PROT|nr:glycerophosphodiester phosphodiesterase [Acetobacteraceae bacterium KSS12]
MPITRRHFLAAAASAPLGAAGALPAAPAGVSPAPKGAGKPLVIGHRGAPALRPEHTLASYAKAIADGADFVEPDLVVTRDGVLVARHESDITETTDVAARPEFAGRRTTRTVDGKSTTGWFTVDFTLAELKTLRARERLPKVRPQNTRFDGEFQVPTFEEIIDFVAAESATRGRMVGLIPELKSVPFFRSIGLPTEDRFVEIISRHRYTREAPLEVQCFYAEGLKRVRERVGRGHANVRLMQLLGLATEPTGTSAPERFAGMMTPAGLAAIATYADVIGPNTRSVIPLRADGRLGEETMLVRDAHAAGLKVHVYTFRPENRFLAVDFRDGAGDDARNPDGSVREIRRYLQAGIDGFFTDDPAIGRRAVDGG